MPTSSSPGPARTSQEPRRARRKPHSIRGPGDFEAPARGWRCSCGAADPADDSHPDAHLRKAAASQLRRMTDQEKLALFTLAEEVSPFEEQCAFDLLRQEGSTEGIFARLQRKEHLLSLVIPYADPVFDHWGFLHLRVNWAKVVAALNDGAIAIADPHDGAVDVLWLAASLAGQAQINLSERVGRIGWGDREALAAAVRRRCDIGN